MRPGTALLLVPLKEQVRLIHLILWFHFEGEMETVVYLQGLVMGISEVLRSVSRWVAQPSQSVCRKNMFVMVISKHPEWGIGFLTFITSLLGDIKAFPTIYFVLSRYRQLHCAQWLPGFFPENASGISSFAFYCANNGTTCCSGTTVKILKKFPSPSYM